MDRPPHQRPGIGCSLWRGHFPIKASAPTVCSCETQASRVAHSTESNLPQTRDLTSALEMTAGRMLPEPGLSQPGPARRRGGSPRPAACRAHSGISAPDLSQSQAATTGLAAHLPQLPEVWAIMLLNIPLSSCQPRSKLQARGGVGLLLKQDSIPLSCPLLFPVRLLPAHRLFSTSLPDIYT